MQPNVLLVTADQWRGDWLGTPFAPTPNLMALAAEGCRLANHHAQMTPCGPSRASLHTGLYGFNHRSIRNGTPLDARHLTLATEARAHGYDPVLFGYTDTTVDPRAVPPDDPRLRRTDGIDPYEHVAPGYRAVLQLPESAGPWLRHLRDRGYGPVDLDWAHGRPLGEPAPFRAEDSETAFLVDAALGWLDHAAEPWFAHVSLIKPHPPFVAAEPWAAAIDPGVLPPPARAPTIAAQGELHPWLATWLAQPFGEVAPPGHPESPAGLSDTVLSTIRRVYAGLIAEVDHHVGRLVGQLRRTGAIDRTLVVFTADHGEMAGDRWMLGKSGFFRPAFHVPAIVRDPRPGSARGRIVEAFTEHVDWMPTILAAIGREIPPQCDGHDLRPWLAGATAPGWRAATHWEHDVCGVDGHEALGLGPHDGGLCARFDGSRLYVHFTALPPLLLDAKGRAVPDEPATELAMARAMLSWRMRHAERRLSGALITPEGIVGRYG